jgi:hypothetical protein
MSSATTSAIRIAARNTITRSSVVVIDGGIGGQTDKQGRVPRRKGTSG